MNPASGNSVGINVGIGAPAEMACPRKDFLDAHLQNDVGVSAIDQNWAAYRTFFNNPRFRESVRVLIGYCSE